MINSSSRILAPLFADGEMTAVFSDEQLVANMVQVEAALAKVQGELGIIPAAAAQEIVAKCSTFTIDWKQLQQGMEKSGVPVINLVQQLRVWVGGEAADFVHWGATTQDILDTAVILQTRTATTLLESKLQQLMHNLAKMADAHRTTIMAGRTHSQQALPISFGLKVAGWLMPLIRHQQRLAEMKPRLLVVQLGGAAGTLAALGDRGTAVPRSLAAELNLNTTPIPWHTQRDTLVEWANWLAMVSGSLAKMAQDIILLAQTEVAEVRESGDASRGGSSTMPQKHNPIISEQIIAAARMNAALLSAMQQAAIQEHERGTHGWQMEWLSLPQMVGYTAVSINKALFLSSNLVVNKEQMQQNIANSYGLMLAEAVSFALTEQMSRTEAKRIVGEACQTAWAEKRHLLDVVREMVGDTPINWEAIPDEAHYLGEADTFIDQVLQAMTSP